MAPPPDLDVAAARVDRGLRLVNRPRSHAVTEIRPPAAESAADVPHRPEPIRIGMVGGGVDAFIGAVHRTAAVMDGEARVIAGALSSTPERSLASGRALGLADDRTYPTWEAMLEGELARDPGERIDLVSIVTPNHLHFAPARAFAAAGFHVMLDKPMVPTSAEAAELAQAVAERGVFLGVTYNYSGFPMVRQARAMVRAGELGPIRKIFVEYHQGWLAGPLEESGQKQASWRTDPARSGIAGAVGDIGTHAEHLAAFVTGLQLESVCADVTTFVPGRRLDDDASVLLRYGGGARGVLTCSQVCIGRENGLTLRVHGERGSLEWRQEHPNHLHVADADGSWRLITRAGAGAGPAATAVSRLPGGHPEGFHEAFANLYRGAFAAIRAHRAGETMPESATLVPDVTDGARGIRFVEAVIASGAAGGRWVPVRA
jgi:predicted dehydrogenase